jgi:undecaprenyl-diphosphatase
MSIHTSPHERARSDRPFRRVLLLVLAIAAGATLLFLAVGEEGPGLGIATAVLLGLVEGATEFLPVSSTGHLAVTQRLLGIGADSPAAQAAADSYVIVIQLGAILAVTLLYHRRLRVMAHGLIGRSADGRRLLLRLLIAFAPAAVTGALAGDLVKANLLGLGPIVTAWFLGGVAILVLAPRLSGGDTDLEHMTVAAAAAIGAAQVLALWPGTSRSLVTILAALAVGMTLRSAVEFSFLLGLLTLGAASAYELARNADVILEQLGVLPAVTGMAAAFVSAIAAVRWLVGYLQRRPLTIFGWYRIAIAILVAGVALT